MSLTETVLKLQRIDNLLTGRQVNYVASSLSNEQLITELEQVGQSLTLLDKLKNISYRLQTSLTTLMDDSEEMDDRSNHIPNSRKSPNLTLRTSQDVLQHLAYLVELINKRNMSKKKSVDLLKWCQTHTLEFPGSARIHDFLSSWLDGLAFASILLYWHPGLFEKTTLKFPVKGVLCQKDALENLQIAFDAAKSVGIVIMLNRTDVVENPNATLIKMQIEQFYKMLKNPRPTELRTKPVLTSKPRISTNIDEKKKSVVLEQKAVKKLFMECFEPDGDSVDTPLIGDELFGNKQLTVDSEDDEEIYRRIAQPRKPRRPLPPIIHRRPPAASQSNSDEEEEDELEVDHTLLDHSQSSKIKMRGYLYKWGNIVKNWKKRYFVFQVSKIIRNDGTPSVLLCYYENETQTKLLGTIPMNKAIVRELHRGIYPRVKNAYHFSVTPNDQQKRVYVFEAESPEDRKDWVSIMVSQDVGAVYAGIQKAKASVRPLVDSIKEGWLEKMGATDKIDGWRIRYFVLRKNPNIMLYYYKTYGDAVKHSRKTERRSSGSRIFKRAPGRQTGGTISLQDGSFELKIHHKLLLGKQYTFSIKPYESNRRYLISAADEKDMVEWVQLISKTVLSDVHKQANNARISSPPPSRKMLGKNNLGCTSLPSISTTTKYNNRVVYSPMSKSHHEVTATSSSSNSTVRSSLLSDASPQHGETMHTSPSSTSQIGSPDSLTAPYNTDNQSNS